MIYLLVFLFVILGLFEATLFPIPLVLPLFIALVVHQKGEWMYAGALILGIYLDILLLRSLGVTSVFFLGITFLCYLYQRKYEILSLPFVSISSFFFSFYYLFLFRYDHLIIKSIFCLGFAILSFYLVQQVYKKRGGKNG